MLVSIKRGEFLKQQSNYKFFQAK